MVELPVRQTSVAEALVPEIPMAGTPMFETGWS